MRPLLMLSAAAISLSLSGLAAASTGPVAAARHDGAVTAATIRWRSEYVLRDGAPATIDLAFPLPEGTVIEPSAGVAPVERAGRVVALRVLPEGASRGRIAVALTEPFDRRGGDARLAPPLAAGDAVQLVDVGGADDLRFEPAAKTGIERHVGFFAPVDLGPSARDACDHAVGFVRARPSDDPVYLTASPALVADEGVRGTFTSAADRLRAGALGAGSVFVVLVVALALLQRRLARAAKIEQAERTLAAEFARLDGAPADP
jgi:hypothetical protein